MQTAALMKLTGAGAMFSKQNETRWQLWLRLVEQVVFFGCRMVVGAGEGICSSLAASHIWVPFSQSSLGSVDKTQ